MTTKKQDRGWDFSPTDNPQNSELQAGLKSHPQKNSPTTRIIDANLNRLREGLRVLEDICRFGYDDKPNASKLKSLRHKIRVENLKELLNSRDILGDVLKKSTKSEMQKENLSDIIIANIKRAQESARVLEEVFKTLNAENSALFKHVRYELYDIEKNFLPHL